MKHLHIANQMRASRLFVKMHPRTGYSITEVVVAALIMGFVVAYGFPSLVAIMRRERLRVAIVEAAGFIQSARQSAMSHSIRCITTIEADGVLTATEDPVTSSNRCTPTSLAGSTNELNLREVTGDPNLTATSTSIGFSFKGTALFDADKEIIISSPKAGDYKYCILVTSPIGFVRMGSQKDGSSLCQYISTN
jgi:type II secretory pathway pseudopilin PulG